MATKTNNGPKSNPGEIKQVLNFIKELLPNRVVKAIDILLHPCCDLGIEATAVCDVEGTYTLTIVLDKKVNLGGGGFYQVFVGGLAVPFAEATVGLKTASWADNTTTLVLTGVDVVPYTAGDYLVTLFLSLPVGYGPYVSTDLLTPAVVTQATTTTNVTFSPCVV